MFQNVAGLPVALSRVGRKAAHDDVARIHSAYARLYWRPRSAGELVAIVTALFVWPLLLLGTAAWFTYQNGSIVERRTGRSVFAQLGDQILIYVRHGILPPWYYVFSLYDGEIRKQARGFINRFEVKPGGIYRLVNASGTTLLDNKSLFAVHCESAGLPAAPVLLEVQPGDEPEEIERQLPRRSIFVKPVRGKGGRGAERWDYDEGAYQRPSGERLGAPELAQRLTRLSKLGPLLVQPRLLTHPAIEDLSTGALLTVRVLTCLNEEGDPELIAAGLCMAVGANVTINNLHAGGISASVDGETGILGPASDLGLDVRLGWIKRHPQSGALIEGRTLPMWDQVVSLALRAHRSFSGTRIVGWDIAILQDGPCLIEGNSGPDLDMIQRANHSGLGSGRFGELLAYHLNSLARS